MIEWMIFLLVWLVSTEIAFFGFNRNEHYDFLFEKFISSLMGVIAALVIYGIPFLLAISILPDGEAIGNIAYIWYYGIILSISSFFGINYAIHRWLEGRTK